MCFFGIILSSGVLSQLLNTAAAPSRLDAHVMHEFREWHVTGFQCYDTESSIYSYRMTAPQWQGMIALIRYMSIDSDAYCAGAVISARLVQAVINFNLAVGSCKTTGTLACVAALACVGASGLVPTWMMMGAEVQI